MSILQQTLSATSRMALNGTTGIAAASIFFHNIASFANIQGDSMYPTLDGGSNFLIVQKWQSQNMVEQGDVVILKSPVDPEILLVKRLIGLPGQTIPVPIDPNSVPPEALQFLPPGKQFTVPVGHVWIEGDNLNQSIDSRHFGAVPQALVVGIARAKFDIKNWSLAQLTKPVLWNAQTRRISPVRQDLFSPKQSKNLHNMDETGPSPPAASGSDQSIQDQSTTQTTFQRPKIPSKFDEQTTARPFPSTLAPVATTTLPLVTQPPSLSIDPAVQFTFHSTTTQSINPYRKSAHRSLSPPQQLPSLVPHQQQSLSLAENDFYTKLTLDQIHNKRDNNLYHQDSQQEIKFQKYLSSYERVHSPYAETVYNEVSEQLSHDSLTMGTNLNHYHSSRPPLPQQQPQLSTQPTTFSLPQSGQDATSHHQTLAPGEQWHLTKQDQLDLLLPQLSPQQRELLLADYNRHDQDSSLPHRSYLDAYRYSDHVKDPDHSNKTERTNPVFSFKWTDPIADWADNHNTSTSHSVQDQSPTITYVPPKPQIGEIRTHLNPYLDVIPQDNDKVVIPTAYMSSIASTTATNPRKTAGNP